MIRKKFSSIHHILFWSVISAAFIGPGTVTTALKSGTLFGPRLGWIIVFSVVACYVLQEASSRITIATGSALPRVIEKRFYNGKNFNFHHLLVLSIVFGCLAYQAGNVAGALAGISLILNVHRGWIILFLYIFSFMVLWNGHILTITRLLGVFVIIMAFVFLMLSFYVEYNPLTIFRYLFLPSIPKNSGIYVIALIGTTIVPYNLFLGSGISINRKMPGIRTGLAGSILIGGLITLLILLSGTMMTGDFSFTGVYELLDRKIGTWAAISFAVGLFSAGITSSITAPLAAAITSETLFKSPAGSGRYAENYFRMVWIVVLSTGTIFSFFDYRPDVLIVMAQAINGMILPFVAFYLFVIMNDRDLIPSGFRNNRWYNILFLTVVALMIFLGIFHLSALFFRLVHIRYQEPIQIILAFALALYLAMVAVRQNRNQG